VVKEPSSGGISEEYGGKYINERKRVKIFKRKNQKKQYKI